MQETDATTIVSCARQQRAHRAEPQPLDLVVDRRILLDVGVAARDVGLRLIVIEVGDEILHRVVREEVLELRVELRRQRLVVAHDQRRLAVISDQVRHRERLPGAGHAEQRLVVVARRQRLRQLGDRLRLVALGLVITLKSEWHRGRIHKPDPPDREIYFARDPGIVACRVFHPSDPYLPLRPRKEIQEMLHARVEPGIQGWEFSSSPRRHHSLLSSPRSWVLRRWRENPAFSKSPWGGTRVLALRSVVIRKKA